MYRRLDSHSQDVASEIRRVRIRVEGLVQGVGFRPFVYSLATRLRLCGFVANDPAGVHIEVEGASNVIARFIESLGAEAPPHTAIEHTDHEFIALEGDTTFAIVGSRADGDTRTLISADIATCDECLKEILDPCDRRYRYAFTNCTNCGPRFTIVRGVPYDRPLTTMALFEMCSECAREYHDPTNRRFHAQPNSCPDCGPRLRLLDRDAVELPGDPIQVAAAMLRTGRIVAVKGLGGYHLATDAENESSVAELRRRKHRDDKPFALMAPDLSHAYSLVDIDDAEVQLLLGARRPIVLSRRRPESKVAKSVAGENRCLGVMLPYTPLHHLLCHEFGGPIVLTSGNLSDEPIAYEDDDALERLSAIADFFLVHNRPIHIRTDDSVVRVFDGGAVQVRRSRGYAPQPLRLRWDIARPILGCGAQLKNIFCMARGNHAFLSHYIGDLENYETFRAFTDGITHFGRLLDINPEVVACDLHPEYLATKYATGLEGVELVPVQHHHAHIVSCLAENGEAGPAIGVAFDGLGYGSDGTLWGGEFMVADFAHFERVGTFAPVPMPGGTAAIRQPWRMAASYLEQAYGDLIPGGLALIERNRRHWLTMLQLTHKRINSPLTSSVGRLFDAVAALAGIRDAVNYEGQAAIELEQVASTAESSDYPVEIADGGLLTVAGSAIVRAIVDDLSRGCGADIIAARFHRTLARVIVEMCERIRERCGLSLVALSGGVFQNQLLLSLAVEGLRARRFRVVTHSRVPANDGGISLGQVVVAASRTDCVIE